MNKSNYSDGFEILIRAMMGEKNVVDHVEAEGQARAVASTMMAKEMEPSREEWEKLGFTFTDIPGDEVLCEASLPEGWSMEETDHPMWINIVDQNGMKRGSMFYKAVFYDRVARMSLHCRYGAFSDYSADGSIVEIYFGSSDAQEKLFVAGKLNRSTLSKEFFKEQDRLLAVAEKFGDKNYPDWRNINAYWDNPIEHSPRLSKKI